MCRILINRTHWAYLAMFQGLTAKKGPIFAKIAPSRTRIRWDGDTGRKALRPYPRTTRFERRPAQPHPCPKNDPGMSFGVRHLDDEAPPTHQDLPGLCGGGHRAAEVPRLSDSGAPIIRWSSKASSGGQWQGHPWVGLGGSKPRPYKSRVIFETVPTGNTATGK
jgi:hypothetical protein